MIPLLQDKNIYTLFFHIIEHYPHQNLTAFLIISNLYLYQLQSTYIGIRKIL